MNHSFPNQNNLRMVFQFVSKLAKLLPPNMNTNQEMNTKELDLNEAETVSGGKIRYKEIEKYLTEEQKKELEEFEKRVANS